MTLRDIIYEGLVQGCGLSEDESRALIRGIIEHASKQGYSKNHYYLPRRDKVFSKAERREMVRQEFNGRNMAELCEKLGVSQSTIYRDLH